MNTTWNFPVEMKRDGGLIPPGFDRTTGGMGWGATGVPPNGPLTIIFPFLFRSQVAAPESYTADVAIDSFPAGGTATAQYFTSIGKNGDTQSELVVYMVYDSAGGAGSFLRFYSYNNAGANVRYAYKLGDENGTDWLQGDKWYQVVLVYEATGFTYAINGSTTPTVTFTDNTPGAIDFANRRWWHNTPDARNTVSHPAQLPTGQSWPSFYVGPTAFYYGAIDVTDAATMARIYDSNGDFKNPGENGSGWFGDYDDTNTTPALGGNTPNVYFVNGAPNPDNGSQSLTWTVLFDAYTSAPGGLRKQYE
jgi:hypothetical protein